MHDGWSDLVSAGDSTLRQLLDITTKLCNVEFSSKAELPLLWYLERESGHRTLTRWQRGALANSPRRATKPVDYDLKIIFHLVWTVMANGARQNALEMTPGEIHIRARCGPNVRAALE